MTRHELLEYYISHCRKNLADHPRAQRFLDHSGVGVGFVADAFMLGFADGSILEFCRENEQLRGELERVGLVKNDKELLRGCIIIPVFDENKEPVNIVGYSINAQKKERMISLRPDGVFNLPFLKNRGDVIFTDDPLTALMLIAAEVANSTFIFGDEKKYSKFCFEHGIRSVLFTYEGSARLFHELTAGGVSTRRTPIDFTHIIAEKKTPVEIRAVIDEVGSRKERTQFVCARVTSSEIAIQGDNCENP